MRPSQKEAKGESISSRTRSHDQSGSQSTEISGDLNQAQANQSNQTPLNYRETLSKASNQSRTQPSASRADSQDIDELQNHINRLSIQQTTTKASPRLTATSSGSSTTQGQTFVPRNSAGCDLARTGVGLGKGTDFYRHQDPLMHLVELPIPDEAYLQQAASDPVRQETVRPILLVMDLNGCLLDRGKNRGSHASQRPFLKTFVDYCSKDHVIPMVWSSATPANVKDMTSTIFTMGNKQPVTVWDRTTLRLGPEHYRLRVQVYKQLQWIWEDPEVARTHPYAMSGGRWDQSNTILIDDSMEKATKQPHNQLLIPVYKKERNKLEYKEEWLVKAVGYLEEAAHHEDVSSFIRACSFQEWISGNTERLRKSA